MRFDSRGMPNVSGLGFKRLFFWLGNWLAGGPLADPMNFSDWQRRKIGFAETLEFK